MRVRIIDSTAQIQISLAAFVKGPIPLDDVRDCLSYAFLVEHHHSDQKQLFDLGLRRDIENYAPVIRELMTSGKTEMEVQDDVATVLWRDEGMLELMRLMRLSGGLFVNPFFLVP